MICASLLTVVIVATGTFKYYVKPKYVRPLVLAVEELLQEDEGTLDLLIQEYEKSLTEDEKLAYELEIDKMKTEETINTTETIEENSADDKLEIQQDRPETPSKDKVIIGGNTVEDLQDKVAPNDLKSGLTIASKIDTGHLLGLAKGGFTADNKKEAVSHLQDRLTSSEYSQLKGLVGKYAFLLK